MAKKITDYVKLQIPAGKATPAPPVGTALGPKGINIMEFCKAFNAKTSAKDQEGLIIPVVITIFSRSLVHLYHQDAAGADSDQTGGRIWRRDRPSRTRSVGKITRSRWKRSLRSRCRT